jgi:DNA repair protein RecN (Recombination protein N)
MLIEIRVRDLGVIEALDLVLGPGMTALTGETGAGKTLVVEALELLVGGRADAALVRGGAVQATVEGRFVHPVEVIGDARDAGQFEAGSGDETVLVREIPSDGRSRAYIDGHMATVAALAAIGDRLVDLHGQHAHQSLLRASAQRRALDHFASADTAEADAARRHIVELDERRSELGGDPRQRAREMDLLAFQVAEIEGARLTDADEEARLESGERVLAAAEDLRRAAEVARDHLVSPYGGSGGMDDQGVTEQLGRAAAELGAHEQLRDLSERLRSALSDITDAADDLRRRAESFESDPERLAAIQERRRLLAELRRKYGEHLSDVIAFESLARRRLADLEAGEERLTALAAERQEALEALAAAEERLGDARRAAAPVLSAAIVSHLGDLALPRGRLEVRVGKGRGDDVEWLFGANPGEPALPLEKVASGGELARVMLATRLVLSEAPPTLVFDEVDAGVGGEAALAVGRALHALAAGGHQVLVVTHLAQVAAFADVQVAVTKEERGGRTVAAARVVEAEDRLVELSRMLSGRPDSPTGRQHAEELLGLAESSERNS